MVTKWNCIEKVTKDKGLFRRERELIFGDIYESEIDLIQQKPIKIQNTKIEVI